MDRTAPKENRNGHPISWQKPPAPGTEAAAAEAAASQGEHTDAAAPATEACVLSEAAGIKGEPPVAAGWGQDAASAAKGRRQIGRGFDGRYDDQGTDIEDARSNEPIGIKRFLGIREVIGSDADGQVPHHRSWQASKADAQTGRQRAGRPPTRSVGHAGEDRTPSRDE